MWGLTYQDYRSNGGLLLNVALHADRNQKLGKVLLEDGNVINTSGSIKIEKYKGIDFSILEPTEVLGGRYTVGKDIPAGEYSLTIKDQSTALSVWGSKYRDYRSDGGLLVNTLLSVYENVTLGKVILKDGNVIDFTSPIVFAPVTKFTF